MITVGIITISDGAAKGERQDLSGERMRSLISQLPDFDRSAPRPLFLMSRSRLQQRSLIGVIIITSISF